MMQQFKTILVVNDRYYVADFNAAEDYSDYSFDPRLNNLRYPDGHNDKIKSVMLTQNIWLAKDFSGTDWQIMTSENNAINDLAKKILDFFADVKTEVRILSSANLNQENKD